MAESRAHKAGKGSAARKEVRISRRRRLDAVRGHYAIEVERSGSKSGINRALSRLKTQTNKRKILRVPQSDMSKAFRLAKQKKMHVTVSNMKKTRYRRS